MAVILCRCCADGVYLFFPISCIWTGHVTYSNRTLTNVMQAEAWKGVALSAPGVAKSQTRLSNFHSHSLTFCSQNPSTMWRSLHQPVGWGACRPATQYLSWHPANSVTSKAIPGASPMVQWLSICLAMQGTLVRSPVQEDPTCYRASKPMCRSYWAWVPEPQSPRVHPPQKEKPWQWAALTLQRVAATTGPQPEKARLQQNPAQPKNKINKSFIEQPTPS